MGCSSAGMPESSSNITALPELAFPQAGPILRHLGLHPLLWRAWSLILQALEDVLIKKHISSWGLAQAEPPTHRFPYQQEGLIRDWTRVSCSGPNPL